MNGDTPDNPAAGGQDETRDQAASDSFAMIVDVLAYLQDSGWKVTKTSLYRHQKEGKILPGPGGSYLRRDVDKYAKAFLKQLSTGKRLSDRMDDLQRRKLEIEVENLELDNKRKRHAYDKEIGAYIPKAQMETELAIRAGILDAGLKHWVKSHVAQWIRLVGGDMQKVGELLSQMNIQLDEHINSYASSSEFEVVVESEDGAEGASGLEGDPESEVDQC